ncbi:MAG: type IV pilus twitching motility protein PilT [Chloroflexi bacterium]|nr:type IV pilus twitching motility protein PilT [Chloroflexota bacterium]
MRIRELLEMAVENRASDLHLTVPSPPILRIDGSLHIIQNLNPLSPKDVENYYEEITSTERRAEFSKNRELDFAYSIPGLTRCRVNILQQRSTISIAVRLIPFGVPTIDELHLPQICKELVLKPMGLILVTGPTGSGKSSTIAAMVNHLNENKASHVITVEDPIEYVYSNKKSLILQRDIGEDTFSFDAALVHALRHDPDVIVLGEIRDINTMTTALRAAETGHLVLGTLHTVDAAQTINRIVDMFPAVQQEQIRNQLSLTLTAVVCQTLIPRADGVGRVPACEVMIANMAVRNVIREGRVHQLYSVIQVSKKDGMQTFNQSMADLMLKGAITKENAYLRTSMIEELKGIYDSYQH